MSSQSKNSLKKVSFLFVNSLEKVYYHAKNSLGKVYCSIGGKHVQTKNNERFQGLEKFKR